MRFRLPTNPSMQRFKTTIVHTSVLALSFIGMLLPIAAVHAQFGNMGGGNSNMGGGNGNMGGGGGTGGGGLVNPLTTISDIPTLLNAILKFVSTQIGPAIVVLMLIYCGFLFVTAQGNQEKLTTARTALMWTVIGAIILLGAATIEGVITSTVNTL